MTVHVEQMRDSTNLPTASPPATLLRRLLLVAVAMVEAAIGLAYLANALLERMPAWAALALSDALTGLAAGLSARWLLKRQSGPLRLAAALAALVGGMVFQGWLTGWRVGLGPLEYGRASPDWVGLGQFSLGMGTALLALYAWLRPPLRVGLVPASPPVAVRRSVRTRRRARPEAARLPSGQAKGLPRLPRRRPSPRALGRGARPAASQASERTVRPKRRPGSRRKTRLQFISHEEHRCPYCLELVADDDPRGSVECKICHTLHHADCWAITGSCQVPHYNA
jgi:hypothetical protein